MAQMMAMGEDKDGKKGKKGGKGKGGKEDWDESEWGEDDFYSLAGKFINVVAM